MAHPFAKHSEEAHGKERAKHLTKAYKRGGKVHSDEAEDKKLFGKMIKKHDAEEKVHGRATGGRLDKFARGGRTKGKGAHHTKININIAPRGHPADGAAPPPLGPPPMAGGPPPGPPGAGGLPPGLGAPPPGAMPPPGMKPPGMMARGGEVKPAPFAAAKMKAGMGSGTGTKQLTHIQKKIRGKD